MTIQESVPYLVISEFYRGKKAERSGVPYIHHIDEGLVVLEAIHASSAAAQAYCLHPLFQEDQTLENLMEPFSEENKLLEMLEKSTPLIIFILAMEYRRTANSYLSRDKLENLAMSPFIDVKHMLIADKVQNRKDFEMYHRQTHPRAEELMEYFMNWMNILGVSEAEYERLCFLIEQDKKARGVVSP